MSSWVFSTPSGHFELQGAQRRLLRNGVTFALGARALDLLLALAEQAGQVVSRSELLDAVWADAPVEENNLSVQMTNRSGAECG